MSKKEMEKATATARRAAASTAHAEKAAAAESTARADYIDACTAEKNAAPADKAAAAEKRTAAENKLNDAKATAAAAKAAAITAAVELDTAAAIAAVNVVAARAKAATEAAKAKAAKAAAAKVCDLYAGKPAELLAARTVRTLKDDKVMAYDAIYNYINYATTDAEKRNVEARLTISAFDSKICGAAKAKAARGRASIIAAAAAGIAESAVNAVVEKVADDIDNLFDIVGAGTHTIKKRDRRAVVAAAFTVDKGGNDTAKESAVLAAVENIASRKLRGDKLIAAAVAPTAKDK